MQALLYSLKGTLSYNKFPLLTILTNVFLGYAFGKILVMPGDELGGSISVRVFLIIGTCLFANYLMCLQKAMSKGINRNVNGKMRPFLREAILCAILNGSVFLLAIALFFIRPYFF